MSTTKTYVARDVMQYHGKAEIGRTSISVAKALPQSATGNLFTVVGSILVHGLVGVISTAFGAVANSPTFGVTGTAAGSVAQNALLAAAPAAAWNANAVGGVIIMPTALGGQLPAPVTASTAAAGVTTSCGLVIANAAITMTCSASTTGNVTWILQWEPISPKYGTTGFNETVTVN